MKTNVFFTVSFRFALFALLLGSCHSRSAKNLNGALTLAPTVETKDYFVGFFGEKTNVFGGQIGHAFIGVGKGVPLTCDIDGTETEMFGFYPKVHVEGGKSLWAGPVDGVIKNDVRTHIDSYVFKKVTFSDYIKVKLKMEEWEKKKYELMRSDCISFFQDVAQTFGDIKLPDRSQFVTPDDYVTQFILINRILN